ncbi:hypothetical protein AB4Y45_17790 [Paraburkholderia sp. EG287A]
MKTLAGRAGYRESNIAMNAAIARETAIVTAIRLRIIADGSAS